MTEKEIFPKIIRSLINQDYKIDPASVSYETISQDTDPLSKRIRLGIEAINFISKAFNIGFESGLKSVFAKEEFKEDIKRIHTLTNYVLFKYVLSQPIIIALIKADELDQNDYKTITNQYDTLMLNFRKHTGKISGTKLSVTGLIFFIFSDSSKAREFENKYQQENKVWHFWKKTWTITWAIDVAGGKVIKHKKLPILLGNIIDAKKMEIDMI